MDSNNLIPFPLNECTREYIECPSPSGVFSEYLESTGIYSVRCSFGESVPITPPPDVLSENLRYKTDNEVHLYPSDNYTSNIETKKAVEDLKEELKELKKEQEETNKILEKLSDLIRPNYQRAIRECQ